MLCYDRRDILSMKKYPSFHEVRRRLLYIFSVEYISIHSRKKTAGSVEDILNQKNRCILSSVCK